MPVTDFLRPAPRFIPESLWWWIARRFFVVDSAGDEQLKPAPSFLPYRFWRFLSKQVFQLDIYKHRAFQEQAPEMLREVLEIAPDAWLYAGTMLGCVREGRIIPWDRDIDLGYPSEIVSDELLERFRAAGFTIERIHHYERPGYRDYVPDAMGQVSKIVVRKGTRIDAKVEIHCFTRGKDGRLYYGQDRPELFVIDYDLVYPLQQIPFYDFMANVPVRLEEHLVYMYGENWREPKKNYIRSAEYKERRLRFYVSVDD
jgi:hypothetical protein